MRALLSAILILGLAVSGLEAKPKKAYPNKGTTETLKIKKDKSRKPSPNPITGSEAVK